MDLALIISRRPNRARDLGARLEGLGLQVEACADTSTLAALQRTPRVVLWDDDAPDMPKGPVPAMVMAAPTHLRIWASATAPAWRMGAILLPTASEDELLAALLDSGYALPTDVECACISSALHKLVNGDAAVVARLVDSLFSSGQADLADYRARCAEKDWTAAGSLAHRLKGTTRMAGCASLTRVCERIESASRNEPIEEFTRLNALFEPAMSRLCDELQRLRRTP